MPQTLVVTSVDDLAWDGEVFRFRVHAGPIGKDGRIFPHRLELVLTLFEAGALGVLLVNASEQLLHEYESSSDS